MKQNQLYAIIFVIFVIPSPVNADHPAYMAFLERCQSLLNGKVRSHCKTYADLARGHGGSSGLNFEVYMRNYHPNYKNVPDDTEIEEENYNFNLRDFMFGGGDESDHPGPRSE